MSRFKSLVDRFADIARAREKRNEIARRMMSNRTVSRQENTASRKQKFIPPIPPVNEASSFRPWADIRAGSAHISFRARTTNELIAPQPWTNGLVNALLAGANNGGVSLCLIWPAKVNSLPFVHGAANLERVFNRDTRGLRTLLFPGTHACRASLNSVLVERRMLSELYRKLWIPNESGSVNLKVFTKSPAFLAILEALNDITINDPELPSPSLAELIPTFVFDQTDRIWSTTASGPLKRTIAKVGRLARRKTLSDKVGSEWAELNKAPGALLIMHHSTTKDSWRAAITAPVLREEGRPEVVLLDATLVTARTNYSAVKRIPYFLKFVRDNGLESIGTVVVTDDPKTFFVLRDQLNDLKISFMTQVWAAEADGGLLSANPVSNDWRPALRSNSYFNVSIVDRDASQLALEFMRLKTFAGNEENTAYQALNQAGLYILRLSNMPAGYSDLSATSAEIGEVSYSNQQNAWTTVQLALRNVLTSGELNQVRDSVERAIVKAEKLIDNWNDATPMASRMLAEVRNCTISSKRGVCLVLPSDSYVRLAKRFLRRKLADNWTVAETRIEWNTLSFVGKMLASNPKGRQFVFVGLNPDALRVLLTHVEVPHGTAVLVAYRPAESTLQLLIQLKEVEEFKAYRGRIGLLATELSRRLAEVPNPIAISKLQDLSFTFELKDDSHYGGNADQDNFIFELEGGGRVYALGWVYRYAPDEDPPFRRTSASTIEHGDLIFDMSDELRTKLESLLQLNSEGSSTVVDPIRVLLSLYKGDVQRRCEFLFDSNKRSVLARKIHTKMVELDPNAVECRLGRVYYWLDLQVKEDKRPHAPRDAKHFGVFCKALGISDESSVHYWNIVKNARRFNRSLGRELVARYAEILFQPESAAIYRKVPEKVILQLQQEALHCVYRVERVIPPLMREIMRKQGE